MWNYWRLSKLVSRFAIIKSRLLRRILYIWVKSKVIKAKGKLNLRDGVPVCYVLRYRSLCDSLVLANHCLDEGLPFPKERTAAVLKGGGTTFIDLGSRGLFQVDRKSAFEPPSQLKSFVRQANKDESFDVQFVPVSVFWGRNPGKEEKSLLRILFFDDQTAGLLQRILIVFAQGRDVFINFGLPLSLRELMQKEMSETDTTKKLRRVLRVHFQKTRTMALGPSLYDRSKVVRELLKSRPLIDAIDVEVKSSGRSRKAVEAKVRSYVEEIVATNSPAVIRVLDRFFTWFWQRVYRGVVVENGDVLRRFASDKEIIIAPSHRSHMDYLLMSYVMYYLGLSIPHTAAGVNLNFWPVGKILRWGGAFYLRRTFKGNRLYTTVFQEYLHFLMRKGHTISYFPEGGRSRSGKLLQPKTGMLSMIAKTVLDDPDIRVVLVPAYISYDKTFEVATYFKELRGSKKRKESLTQFLKLGKIFRANLGRATISFAEPIDVRDFLRSEGLDSTNLAKGGDRAVFSDVVNKLAIQMMRHINDAGVITPVGLVASILMALKQRALVEEDLFHCIEILNSLCAKADSTHKPLEPKSCVETAEELSLVNRFSHPGGDVLYLGAAESIYMNYCRNNIINKFALLGLVASCFQDNESVDRSSVEKKCLVIYPLLQAELFLSPRSRDLAEEVNITMDRFKELGLVEFSENSFRVKESEKMGVHVFTILRSMISPFLERYAAVVWLLLYYKNKKEEVKLETFESECMRMAQRIALLSGGEDIGSIDVNSFKPCLESLRQKSYISIDKDGCLKFFDKMSELSIITDVFSHHEIRFALTEKLGN